MLSMASALEKTKKTRRKVFVEVVTTSIDAIKKSIESIRAVQFDPTLLFHLSRIST